MINLWVWSTYEYDISWTCKDMSLWETKAAACRNVRRSRAKTEKRDNFCVHQKKCYLGHGVDDKIAPPTCKITRNDKVFCHSRTEEILFKKWDAFTSQYFVIPLEPFPSLLAQTRGSSTASRYKSFLKRCCFKTPHVRWRFQHSRLVHYSISYEKWFNLNTWKQWKW